MSLRRMLPGLVLALALLGAAPSFAATQVGVAAAVRGSVQVVRAAAVGSAIQSGAKLYLGDKIATGPAAGLQILLLDETVFTLGPDSQMTIDEFVYDPASANGKLDAKLVKGAFRFISGRVARKDPRQMNVALPSGTIGIRGTMVYSLVDAETGASTVVLSGPGAGNTTGETAGAIEVSNADVTQEVLKSGWGVQVPGFGQPPSEPFPVPADFYDAFQFEVAAPAATTADEDSGDSDGSAESEEAAAPGDSSGSSETSSSSDADAESESSPAAEAGSQLEAASAATQGDQVLLDSLSNVELPLPDPVLPDSGTPEPPPAPVFTPTLVAELTNLAGTFFGHYLYVVEDAPLVSGGRFDLIVDLHFGQQVLGVQLKEVVSSPLALNGGNMSATSVPIDDMESIQASYDVTFPYMDISPSCSPSGCVANVQLLFENKDAQLAGVVSANVTVTAPTLQISDTGSIDDVPITTIQP